MLASQKFDGVISIIDPGRNKTWFPHQVQKMRKDMEKHCKKILQLQFWDTIDTFDVGGPREHHILAIKNFATEMRGKKLAIHCMFGLARSPAAAIIVLRTLGYSSDDALAYVKQIQPLARPNILMLKLNDSIQLNSTEIAEPIIDLEDTSHSKIHTSE